MRTVTITYTDLKNLILDNRLFWQYQEFNERYDIFSANSETEYLSIVWKSGFEPKGVDVGQNTTDRTDFETNYKDTANPRVTSFSQGFGFISILNSTSTPLGISGVFTGEAEDATDYSIISLFVYASHASAIDGLSVEWSTDGTNWDDSDNFTVPAGNGKFFTLAPETKYYRVVYTNGVIAQTDFRLQVILHYNMTKPSSHRIQDSISTDDDAELVKSVITGQNDLDSFENVRTDTGRLKVINTSNDEILTENANMFSATTSKTIDVTEIPLFLIRNPNGSGKTTIISNLLVAMLADFDIPVAVNYYATPTVSATGSATTSRNTHIGSSNTATTLAYAEPTITGNGNLLFTETFNRSSSSVSSIFGKIQLDANQDLLITAISGGVVATAWRISVLFSERIN